MKNALGYAALAAVLVLAGCGNDGSASSHASAVTIAKEGAPAPPWSLKTDAGGMLTQGGLKGKAVYLNFFATWCPPCNEEAPSIERLYNTYEKDGLVVVGVDEQENAAKAKLFRNEHGLTYPIVVDDGSLLREAYAVNGLPEHAFIAPDGTVKKIVIGEMDPPEIQSAIQSILK